MSFFFIRSCSSSSQGTITDDSGIHSGNTFNTNNKGNIEQAVGSSNGSSPSISIQYRDTQKEQHNKDNFVKLVLPIVLVPHKINNLENQRYSLRVPFRSPQMAVVFLLPSLSVCRKKLSVVQRPVARCEVAKLSQSPEFPTMASMLQPFAPLDLAAR